MTGPAKKEDHYMPRSKSPLSRAESLSPSVTTIERAVIHDDPEAAAILAAWKYRPHTPIIVMTRQQLEAACNR